MIFFKSFWNNPVVAAKNAVNDPITIINCEVINEYSKKSQYIGCAYKNSNKIILVAEIAKKILIFIHFYSMI